MMEEQVYTSAADVEPKVDSGSDTKSLNFSTVKRRYSADVPTEKPKLPALNITKGAAPNDGPMSSRGDSPISSKAPAREPAKSDAKTPIRPATAVPQSMKPKGSQGPLIGLSKRGHRKHVGNTVNLSGAPIPYFPPTVYGKISDMEARLPLSEIMGFTQYRNALRQFMEEHLCHENFDFLTIVEDFEQHVASIPSLKKGEMAADLSALQSLYLDAKLIYDHYVHEGAEQQVNMSGQARTLVEKHMEQFATLLKFRQQAAGASTLSLASASGAAPAPAPAADSQPSEPTPAQLKQRRPSYAEVTSGSISMSDLQAASASGAPVLTFRLEHLFTNAKEIIWRMVENDAVKRFLESHAYLDMLSAALEDQFQPVFQFEGKTFENVPGYKSVHVDVLSGCNLGLKQVDAYVVMNVDGNSFRSKTVRSSKEPHWNQHFEFPVTATTQALEMDVYDSALMGRGAYLGSILVPLISVIPDGADVWYQLLGRSRALPQHAGIQMRISLSKNAPSKAKKNVSCLSFN